MNCEMTVGVGSGETKIFMQDGFKEFYKLSPTLHKHRYSEIHIVASGEMHYSIAGREYVFKKGEAFVVPGGAFHKFISSSELMHTGFQTDMYLPDVAVVKLHDGVATGLIESIRENSNLVGAYLGLICTALSNTKNEPVPIQDRAFLIYEFFAYNYDKDITLADLAAELRLSEKQAERLVVKYTGNNFRKEITKRRLQAAENLSKEGKMSLSEIAVRVGYKSYSGYWKAKKESCLFDKKAYTTLKK